MNPLWIATIGAGLVAFTLKYTGHSIPAHLLAHPKIQRINTLIPIALLSALVAVQSFTQTSRLIIDHRLAGVGVALIALLLKAPFPVVVLSAAISSAAAYRIF